MYLNVVSHGCANTFNFYMKKKTYCSKYKIVLVKKVQMYVFLFLPPYSLFLYFQYLDIFRYFEVIEEASPIAYRDHIPQ